MFLKRKKQDITDPTEHNDALFSKFYHDLENNSLPTIPEPTCEEIEEYTKFRKERTAYPDTDMQKFNSNLAIPVEVEIWVNKVYAFYFDKAIYVFGSYPRYDAVLKSLYKHRGYAWYCATEIHKGLIID